MPDSTIPRCARESAKLGGIPLTGSSADFRKLFVDDAQKWAKVMYEGEPPTFQA
jgi:hypothetical protein